jgi:hypothetical protein
MPLDHRDEMLIESMLILAGEIEKRCDVEHSQGFGLWLRGISGIKI